MTAHKIATREEWRCGPGRAAGAREGTHPDGRRASPAAPGASLGTGREAVHAADRDGPKTLAELFDGRSQLLIYHFMFGPSYEAGCPVNCSIADTFDSLIPHLKARDVTLIAVSGAPIEKLLAYRERMGWSFDLGVELRERFQRRLRFLEQPGADARGDRADSRPAAAGRLPQRRGRRHGHLRLPDRAVRLHRVHPRGRDRLPDVLDDGSRGRVPDALLRVPRPGAEGPRRGRGMAALDPPPRRVRHRSERWRSRQTASSGHFDRDRPLCVVSVIGDEFRSATV